MTAEDWQPIGSLPTDYAKRFLGYDPHFPDRDNQGNRVPAFAHIANLTSEGMVAIVDDCRIADFQPTHWMPLPAPPVQP